MEQRRLITFALLSFAFFFFWMRFVAPKFMPQQPAAPQNQAGEENPGEVDPLQDDGIENQANANTNVQERNGDDPVAESNENPEDDQVKLIEATEKQSVVLGSLDRESGYLMQVKLHSVGAAVQSIQLNDERYRNLERPDEQLLIVGNNPEDKRHTLDLDVPLVKNQLDPFDRTLKTLNWTTKTISDPENDNIHSAVIFTAVAPDRSLELVKKYWLVKADRSAMSDARNLKPEGYQLHFDFTIRNLSDKPKTAAYRLLGPIGLPLEDQENAQKFRDIRIGFLNEEEKGTAPEDQSVSNEKMTAGEVIEEIEEAKQENRPVEEWQAPIRYIGVDVQYFAALLVPEGNQLENPYVAKSRPILVEQTEKEEHSDVSVRLTSRSITLPARADGKPSEVTHSWLLYAGPKREELLESMGAASTVDFGWFGIVSRMMLGIMKFLHDNIGLPYGIAIIMLTVIVRACMFPLSKKQAASTKKMKELQPKLAELKKKYADDKQKFAQEQMKLFSKHNYNPFAGCLPIFIQLPIFIGLYQALRNSVDLRMAEFLWVDNLAAPDALIKDIGFSIPFLGSSFNLLPIITIVLFIAQQKMFMPPPTDEQQALQQKMMSYMMVFMGFLFYRVPAGLCVYFIASSLFGLAERKFLDWRSDSIPDEETESEPFDTESKSRKGDSDSDDIPREGFWGKLMAAADEAANKGQQGTNRPNQSSSSNGSGSSNKKNKRKNKSRR